MSRKKVIFIFIFTFFVGVISFFSLPKNGANTEAKVKSIFDKTSGVCAGSAERTKYIVCYKKNLEPGIKKYGLKPFMSELGIKYASSVNFDNGGINQCHDVAHAIGQTAGAYSKDLNKTILDCPNLCTSGCFHGVVEGAISTGFDILGNIGNLCRYEEGGKALSTNTDCFHGLGHGVADLSGFDLVQALKYCDLINTEEGQRSCGAGVIMELYEPSSFDHALLQFPDDIAKFCKDLWGTYRETCYITAGTHIFIKESSTAKAISACFSVPDEYKKSCISALGQNMFFVYQGNFIKLSAFCQNLPGIYPESCYGGVIESSVMSDPLVRKGMEICQSFDDNDSQKCFDGVIQRMIVSNRTEKVNEICDQVTNDKKQLCLDSLKNATK